MSLWWVVLALGIAGATGYWWWSRTRRSNPGGGEADRLYRQGMNCRQGTGVALDYAQARQLLLQAAEMGQAAAQYDYGMMLHDSLGGPHDAEGAMHWMAQSAEAGDVRAQLHMGKSCLAGEGIAQDTGQAVAWLLQAAEAGNAEAQYLLATLYRDKSSPLWNSAKAANWMIKAAEQNQPAALYALSEMYEHGSGVGKNLHQADALLLKAAQRGVPEAMFRLGKLYLNGAFGHTFPQDYHAALDWFRRAGAQGIGEAEYEVGLRYERNEGVPEPDMRRAAECFLSAAKLGFAPAQYRIAQLYRYGHHVPLDLDKAKRWFAAAAAQGYGDAAEQVKALRARVQEAALPPVPPDESAQIDSQGVDWKG